MRLRIVIGLAAVVVVLSGTPASGAGPLPPLPLPPVNIVPPSIAGNAVAGSTVVCSPGQWLNAPSVYQYSWQRDLVSIGGPSPGNQYTLTPSDAGHLVTCTVTAANGAGNGVPAISPPIVPASGTQAGQGDPGGSGGPNVGSGPEGGGGPNGGSASAPGAPTGQTRGSARPAMNAFSARPRRMLVVTGRSHARTRGLTLEYTLARPAQVVIVIEKRVAGRELRGSCRAITAASKKAAPCERYIALLTLIVTRAPAGKGRLWYSGRVGNRLLGDGPYRAIAAAVTSGGWSPARSVRFSVVRKRGR